MKDYSIYITSIGNNSFNAFIKNKSYEADFIRIIIGYTEIDHAKRVGRVLDSWIISPLSPSNNPVFIQNINKRHMHNRRVWIAFESMKRNKPRAIPLGSFIALSPTVSKWKRTVGSSTNFIIKSIETIKSIEGYLNQVEGGSSKLL